MNGITIYQDGREVTHAEAAKALNVVDGSSVQLAAKADGFAAALTVDVYPRFSQYGDQTRPPMVNWAGFGSQGPEVTRAFAHLLDIAANLIDLAEMSRDITD